MIAGVSRVGGGIVAMTIAALAAALLIGATVGTQKAQAAFPGANGKIVFDSDRLLAAGGPGLYTITPGGTATKISGTSAGDNQPVWSPDGSRIAFQSSVGSTNQEIFVMNADGSGRIRLTDTTTTANSVTEGEPTWSPDGSRIAFVANRSGTDTTTDREIWMMNSDGSGLVQLTNNEQGDDTEPAWSPDGERIAFVSEEGRPDQRNIDIYVMDANPATSDTLAINLTPDDFTTDPVYQPNDKNPNWSPDGSQITYDTVSDVWKMNADGTGKTNLTRNRGGGSEPSWSPDNASIAYVRADGTDRNIYRMNADGSNTTALDTTARSDVKPDWQPDPPTCDPIPGRTNGDDTVTGNPAEREVICGLGGNDTITGQDGDILLGGEGNDRLQITAGRGTLNGGVGNDTATFAGASTGIDASLISGFARRVGATPLEGVALVGIESMVGSEHDDDLTGSNGKNRLTGGLGADELSGLGKADTLNSRDRVGGNDAVDGGPGTDECIIDRGDVRTSCP